VTNKSNEGLVVNFPSVLSTVGLRGTNDDDSNTDSRYFDLSELRSLGVDRTSTGTQICGANLQDGEEKAAKRGEEELDSAKRQQRVEMLEILFDSKGNVNQA
jgi:hypothetical protein